MRRTEIKEDLWYIEEMVNHFCRNPDDPGFMHFAACEMPYLTERIHENLIPWYERLWLRLKAKIKRTVFEDEIPF